jgi:hypothetical protein
MAVTRKMDARAEICGDFLKEQTMNRIVIDNKDAKRFPPDRSFQGTPILK